MNKLMLKFSIGRHRLYNLALRPEKESKGVRKEQSRGREEARVLLKTDLESSFG